MSSIKAYRFQLRTRPRDEALLRRFAGAGRWVWNQALAEQRARHARGEKYASYVDMAKWLTTWRNDPATSWLSDSPIHPQQQVLRRLDEAYKRFFAAAKAGLAGGQGRIGPPSFKRRGDEPGIRYPDHKQFALDTANERMKLPKLGWLRLRMSQPVDGLLRNVCVSREGSAWFVSIQVQVAETVSALGVAPTLGIDLGLAKFASLSDGSSIEPLKALTRQQRRLRRYQRSVSRKVKGSANRRKAVRRLGNLHRRIAHQRSDWLHKLTTDLADAHPVIALEDLRITNMSASARGTIVAPGKNVAAKAGLNRGILDAAWGEFARQITYKVQWRGGQVILVNPAYTSRTCRVCGHEAAENRKTQSVFACLACGHTENADVHAAKNVLDRGIALFEAQRSAAGHAVWLNEEARKAAACGGDVSRAAPERQARVRRAAPMKQEPTDATSNEASHA
jgi:putative transposase